MNGAFKANNVFFEKKNKAIRFFIFSISGIILSPGTTLLRSNDIKYRVNAASAKCIITNAACADHVDEVSCFRVFQAVPLIGRGKRDN